MAEQGNLEPYWRGRRAREGAPPIAGDLRQHLRDQPFMHCIEVFTGERWIPLRGIVSVRIRERSFPVSATLDVEMLPAVHTPGKFKREENGRRP